MGAITNVWCANPAALTAASTRAFPVKWTTLRRPPVSLSQSGKVDQIKCWTPAARAACTAAVPISVSRGACAGSQKLVTTKAPCAPVSAERRLPGSSRSALTTSTPRTANARAASLAGLRLATRTANLPASSRASTTPPPCCPVPPRTATTGLVIIVSLRRRPAIERVRFSTEQPSVRVLTSGRYRRSAATASIDAEAAGAESGNLQQASRHGDVLQEMKQLVLICEIVVEGQRGGNAEDREDKSGQLRLKAEDEKNSSADLDGDRDQIDERWEGQPRRCDVALGHGGGEDLADTAVKEDHGKQQAAKGRDMSRSGQSFSVSRWLAPIHIGPSSSIKKVVKNWT